MLFMVVERFAPGQLVDVYAHLRKHGRGLPVGLEFVDSWMAAILDRCFQLMRCNDVGVFQEWAAQWGDLIDIEVVPVVKASETAAIYAQRAEPKTDPDLTGRSTEKKG